MKRSTSFPGVIFIVPRLRITFIGYDTSGKFASGQNPPCHSRLKLLLVLDVRAGLDTGLGFACV
jgi:hypothetical protein